MCIESNVNVSPCTLLPEVAAVQSGVSPLIFLYTQTLLLITSLGPLYCLTCFHDSVGHPGCTFSRQYTWIPLLFNVRPVDRLEIGLPAPILSWGPGPLSHWRPEEDVGGWATVTGWQPLPQLLSMLC